MNKQKLTKTFSFSKWLLFFFFAVGLTLSSCGEDYDDDIEDLRNKWESVKDYQATKDKLASLETSLAQAKASAEQAAKDAAEALAAANKIGDVKAIADASAKVAAEAAKAEAIADADAKLKALEKKLQDKIDAIDQNVVSPVDKEAIIKEILKSLDADMKALEEAISKVIGHRLTSIAFIPDLPHGNINGIPAMKFYSLSYVPQTFVVHDSLAHTTVAAGKGEAVSLSNQEMTVRYRMNPRVGVRTEDLLMPSFDCIISENDMSRSTAVKPGVNIPIKPVAAGVVREDGVYELKVTKSVAEDIDREWLISNKDIERFYMASLNVPIADSGLTAEEIENGTKPSVHSEYVRIADKVVTPFLKQAGTLAHNHSDDVYDDAGVAPNIYPHLNEQDAEGRYLHYHDSTALYKSVSGVLVDHIVGWDENVDLKKLVDVCIIDDHHNSLENYKGYGLTFRFYLANVPYYQGLNNNTDQQRFARIDNPQNGILTSKVYDYNGDGGGKTQTAIGREPIVRAMLVDTINNKLVAQRYIKLKFGAAKRNLDPYTFPEHYVSCDTVYMRFGTQEMNERVYRKIEAQYGLSKTEFHALYKDVTIDSLFQDGVKITDHNVSINTPINYYSYRNTVAAEEPTWRGFDYSLGFIPDPNETDSYNLAWIMDPEAVGKVGTNLKPRKSTYELYFKFTSGTSEAIAMKFIVDIKIPDQKFDYLQSAWRNGGSPAKTTKPVFNVNPFVYETSLDGDAGTVASLNPLIDYSHIEADLVNGWIYKKGTGEWADGTNGKPANLAQFIRMIRTCADVKFEFDASKQAQYTGQKDADGITKADLSDYAISADGVELWKNIVGVSTTSTAAHLVDWKETNVTPDYVTGGQQLAAKDTYEYLQDPTMAASISNLFGATALENQGNLAWDYNEELGKYPNYLGGGTKGVASSIIRLHEKDKKFGTDPAIDLIDKKLPVRLVVEYNVYNKYTEQEFEVFFVNPLTVTSNISGNFEDAVINGSYLDANEGLAFTDWNGYLVAKRDNPTEAPLPIEKERYPWDLWNYYAVDNVIYDVNNVKTSLKWDGSTYVNDNNVTNGDLPSTASLKQAVLTWNAVTKEFDKLHPNFVSANPTHLGYFNNSGTPVNTNFWLYIPLKVTYKWGNILGNPVKVEVVKAGGTPSNPNP